MNSVSGMLEQRKKELEALRQKLMKQQKKYPAGTLRISKCRGKAQYYHRTEASDRLGKYLTPDKKETAMLLAQKDYDRRLRMAAEKEISAIKAFLDRYPSIPPEKIFESLSEDRMKLITPFYETDEMFMLQWCSKEYEGLPFKEDSPELYTDRGERVRSKSEVIIANLMAKENIPYRYECPLYLDGFGTVHPDFTALNVRKRKEYYWEHLGMMEDPEYSEKAVRKISAYIKNGIFPGEQLILTAETKEFPVNVREVKILIQHYLQ